VAIAGAAVIFLFALALTRSASAQLSGQSFTVTPASTAATVGDSVSIRFRIRLHERDQPLDSIPQVVGDLPPGVRVLMVEKLTRSGGRVFEGGARLAFYRTGRRPVPVFGLPFMRVVEGVARATLPSDSAFVDVAAVLPAAGNPALKDIRELEPRSAPAWPAAALAMVLLAAAGFFARFRRRRRPQTAATEPGSPVQPAPPSAYEVALGRLNRVEAEHWPAQGKVALHYEAVAQTLRQYLEDAHDVGALERTTSELLWAIPPHLGKGGLREQCLEVLTEADLVKFAAVRPRQEDATDFMARARLLLTAWNETSREEESAHALR
jgi:hypothetical protein